MVAGDERTAARPPRYANRTAQNLLIQVQELSDQLALVNGMLRTLVKGATLQEVLLAFASNVKVLCPFDCCSIALYDEERRRFRVPYLATGSRILEVRIEPFESPALAEVVRTGKPMLRRDVREDRRHFDCDSAALEKEISCDMIFPLQVGTRPFGTFNVGAIESERLDEHHLRLIQDVVPAVAVAVWHHLSEGRQPT